MSQYDILAARLQSQGNPTELISTLYQRCIKDSMPSVESTIDQVTALRDLFAADRSRTAADIKVHNLAALRCLAQLSVRRKEILQVTSDLPSTSYLAALFSIVDSDDPISVTNSIDLFTELILDMETRIELDTPRHAQHMADVKAAGDLLKALKDMFTELEMVGELMEMEDEADEEAAQANEGGSRKKHRPRGKKYEEVHDKFGKVIARKSKRRPDAWWEIVG